jgi:hypothetical protein
VAHIADGCHKSMITHCGVSGGNIGRVNATPDCPLPHIVVADKNAIYAALLALNEQWREMVHKMRLVCVEIKAETTVRQRLELLALVDKRTRTP